MVLRTIMQLYVCQYKIMQTITIAELAEPRIGTNVPRSFSRVRGGVWEQDCTSRLMERLTTLPETRTKVKIIFSIHYIRIITVRTIT